jgi:hypothetical protein
VVVSATECAASASIEADPVNIPATAFITAIKALAPSATMTVSVLSPPLESPSAVCLRESAGCAGAPVTGRLALTCRRGDGPPASSSPRSIRPRPPPARRPTRHSVHRSAW